MHLNQAPSKDEVKERGSGITQPARKHHYIPKFYQRGFTADGMNRIWVYEKGREPRQYSVRKTGMMIDLYGFTNRQKEFETDTVEKELARIDSEAARIVKKLEGGFSIDNRERHHLCRFVSVMWRRTPKHKEEAEKRAATMIPKFFAEHDETWLYAEVKRRARSVADVQRIYEQQKVELKKVRKEYSGRVPDFLFAKNTVRHSMFEQVMYAMDWAFFQSTPEEGFLTCDNPVAFNKGSGLKDKEAVILFPLSRRLLLQAMWISDYGNKFVRLANPQIRDLNRYTVRNAHRQVYAWKRSKVLSSFVSKWIGTF